MNHDTLLKSFSIIPPALFFGAVLFMLVRWKAEGQTTISTHSAQNKLGLAILGFILIGGGVMYCSLFWYWLRPKYHPPFFSAIILVALLCLFIAGAIPAHPNKRHLTRIHETAAGIIGVAMCLSVWVLIRSGMIADIWARISMWAFVVFTITAATLLISIPKIRRHTLPFEISFIFLFCLFIGLITYT